MKPSNIDANQITTGLIDASKIPSPKLSDAEVEANYRRAQGLDCQDASRQFFLKKAKKKGKEMGYKMSGYNKLRLSQLRAIANQ